MSKVMKYMSVVRGPWSAASFSPDTSPAVITQLKHTGTMYVGLPCTLWNLEELP